MLLRHHTTIVAFVFSFIITVSAIFVGNTIVHAAPVFTVGTRIQTIANLNVRSGPGTIYSKSCTQPMGALGTLVGGPQSANGYWWWNIAYDAGCSGWSVQKYITVAMSADAPPTAPMSTASGTSDPIIFLTSGTTWTVPSNWNSNNNSIESIGGGGGGSAGGGQNYAGRGGGGGAYAKIVNYQATPGQVLNIQVGQGGAGASTDGTVGSSGTDTWFGSTNVLLAKGGAGGPVAGTVGAAGGQASASVGAVKYSGGAGGAWTTSAGAPGSGGGGAGGPSGAGAAGGSTNGNNDSGAGGGGQGGGTIGGTASSNGGNGGNNHLSTGGGAGGLAGANPGAAGSNGGGGGGGGGNYNAGTGASGGAGGSGTDWDSIHGAGGGGGGGGYSNAGAAGGLYGAGGGGGGGENTVGPGANGAPGIIVITYVSSSSTPAPTATLSANPTSITSGQSSTLSWNSTNATSCTGTNFSTGGIPSGTVSAAPTTTTTYSVNCTGTGGTATASATVTVASPIFTYSLSNGGNKSVATGSSISQTVTATLTGGTTQAVSYAVSGLPSGALLSFPACSPTCTSTGTITTTPTMPAGTYTITITGSPNTTTSSFLLTVASTTPTATLSANPTSITSGQSSTLSWNSTNATSCTGTNFSTGGIPSGTVSAAPTTTTTYSVNCTGTGGTATASATVTVASSSFTPIGMRVLPDPLYGVTVDGTSNTSNIVASSQHLSHFPTTRIVFDYGQAPSVYDSAVTSIQPVSYILGLPVDSSSMTNYTVTDYKNRFNAYLGDSNMASKIDLWEIGNEINGNWTGNYTDVASKVYAAWQIVHNAGKRTELTLYYNPNNCDGSSELDPVAYTKQYLAQYPDMLSGLHYVLLSYYETQCNNYRPSAATLTAFFNQLHALYPNARLGFAEIGLPNAVTSSTYGTAKSILDYYYQLQLTSVPNYVGGYFWWYYYEDMLPYATKTLWTELNTNGFPYVCCSI